MPERINHCSEAGIPRMDPRVVMENTSSQFISSEAAMEGRIQEAMRRTQLRVIHGVRGTTDERLQCCPECVKVKGKGVHCDTAVDWSELLGRSPAPTTLTAVARNGAESPSEEGSRPPVSRDIAKAQVDDFIFHKVQALQHAIVQKTAFVNILHMNGWRCLRAWEAAPHEGLGEDGGPEKAAALQACDTVWLETLEQGNQLRLLIERLRVMERDAPRMVVKMEDAPVGGWGLEDAAKIGSGYTW